MVPHSQEILLIDKPSGMTSHDVVDAVRLATGEKCVGHAGTLDPLATGLLIVLVGRHATMQQASFMEQDKEYLCRASLGYTTDTYDSDGQETTRVPWSQLVHVTQDQLENLLPHFTGHIEQTVPPYSAVRHHGHKLYDLARQHKLGQVTLPHRAVDIHSLELTEFFTDSDTETVQFELRIRCGSGTYVRSLMYDLGQKLGVGATVTALRRTKIGKYDVEDAVQLDQLQSQK